MSFMYLTLIIYKNNMMQFMTLMKENKIYSAYTVKDGGVIEAVSKMAFGNGIGVAFNAEYDY